MKGGGGGGGGGGGAGRGGRSRLSVPNLLSEVVEVTAPKKL